MIYIKTNTKFKTVHELLTELYPNTGSYGGEYFKPVTTYSDKECKFIQCYANKIRSFDDLSTLILTYFPDLKTEEILHEIITFQPVYNYQKYLFYPAYCGNIMLITVYYYYVPVNYSTVWSNMPRYSSKYSWEELFNMFDIKNPKELYEYIDKSNKEKEQLEVLELC